MIIVKTCPPRCGGFACPLMDTKNCLSFLLPLSSPIRVVLTPLPETFPLYTKFYDLYRLISTSRLDSSPSFILPRSPELQGKESKESPLLLYALAIYHFHVFILKLFIFNWRIIALQSCSGFYHTST